MKVQRCSCKLKILPLNQCCSFFCLTMQSSSLIINRTCQSLFGQSVNIERYLKKEWLYRTNLDIGQTEERIKKQLNKQNTIEKVENQRSLFNTQKLDKGPGASPIVGKTRQRIAENLVVQQRRIDWQVELVKKRKRTL